MTKKELIAGLSHWSDEAEIEISVPVDLDSEDPRMEDKIWLEIDMVEMRDNASDDDGDQLCLLYAGKIMMG